MVDWWQAILLGLIQGLTEFIPVSSSAHLNIAHWLLGHKDRNLTYDVFLNIGTLLALGFYFRHDWAQLLRNPEQKQLRNLVFAACVPAGVIGFLSRDLQDDTWLFVDPRANAMMLVLMGLLLLVADRIGRKRRTLEQVNWKDALIVGCSQALALIPGVSRSGATITAGLFRRLTREAAARFSFLMSLPITLGATIFETRSAMKLASSQGWSQAFHADVPAMILGVVFSAVSGFWAIGFLLNYLKTRDVTLFVKWRVLVALLVFTVYYWRANTAPPAPQTAMKPSHAALATAAQSRNQP
jgi:undecaprenyl-diphosphatase